MQVNYNCANCNQELTQVKGVDFINVAPPQVNDILLCAGCGRPNVVALDGLRLLTDEEFEALDDEEKRDLNFVQRSMIKEKLPKNGSRRI